MCADATTTVGLPEASEVNVSDAEKVESVLFVPLFKYFTNKVSGSVPSVATTFTTFAVTPLVPVNTEPL